MSGYRSRNVWGAALLLAGCSMPLAAQDAAAPITVEDAAIRFGARADVLDVSLSPSGKKLAYVAAGPSFTELVYVIDLSGDLKPRPIASNSEQIADVDWCEWATESRLVCQISGMAYGPSGVLLPYDRLFAVNDDGSNAKELSKRQSANALQALQFGGDVIALDVGG